MDNRARFEKFVSVDSAGCWFSCCIAIASALNGHSAPCGLESPWGADYHRSAQESSGLVAFHVELAIQRELGHVFDNAGQALFFYVEEHVRRLQELRALGVDQFAVYLQHDDKDHTLAAYGEKIIPLVQEHLKARD